MFRLPASPAARSDQSDGRFGADSADSTAKSAKKPAKQSPTLVPVTCGLCSTRMYAKLDQIGQSIECPDCYTSTVVKPVPKSKLTQGPSLDAADEYQMGAEPERAVVHSRADELMQEAEQQVEQQVQRRPVTLARPLTERVFSYPFTRRVFPVGLGLAVCWALIARVTHFGLGMGGFAGLLAPFVFAFVGILLVGLIFPTLIVFQRIFETTVLGDDDAGCLPEGGLLAIVNWMGEVVAIIVALAICAAPGSLLVQALGLPPVYHLAGFVLAWLLFPVVYVSMMEQASAAGLYSAHVWGSVTRRFGGWLRFQLLSLIIGAVAVAAAIGVGSALQFSGSAFVANLLLAAACFVGWASVAVFFRLLARLAVLIRQWQDEDERLEASEEYQESVTAGDSRAEPVSAA